MKPKLSVIIPCYNMGQFIQETIDSVIDVSDIEIIIVNDGSDDNGFTRGVLDAIQNDKIKIIHQDNKGLGHARNTGVKMAKAPYLAILDSDNKLRHDYINIGISILDEYPEIGLVYGNYRQFGMYDKDVIVGDLNISDLVIKNYIDACVILRKEAWASIGGYDEVMPVMGYEDWDLNLRLFFKGWQFKYIEKVLFDYRVRENSMLTNTVKNKVLLQSYIFSKPSLHQAKLIREKLQLLDDLRKTIVKQEIRLNDILNSRTFKMVLTINKFLKRIKTVK